MVEKLVKVAKIAVPILSLCSGIISEWANDKKMEAIIAKKVNEAWSKRK